MIIKVRHYSHTYPPAVVALLVCSLLQALYILWLFVKSGRGFAFKASTFFGSLVFFACFSFGEFAVLDYDLCKGSIADTFPFKLVLLPLLFCDTTVNTATLNWQTTATSAVF